MSFFNALKKKVQKEPDRLFDQRFWAKFDREFSPEAVASPFTGLRARFWRWASPVAFAGALAIAMVYGWGQRATHLVEEQARQAELLLDEDLVDNLDTLATIDEHKLHDLDDEEWETLLSEGDERAL